MNTTSTVQKKIVSGAPSSEGFILPLNGLTHSDLNRVGSKAANLGELASAGFLVPDGFIVSTAAFDQFVDRNHLGPDSTPDLITAAPVPEEIEQAIRMKMGQMSNVPLAVRSSGVAEDLSGTSFAGQYDTLLGVLGPDAVIAAVRQCWASAFNNRLSAYRSVQGKTEQSGMAVLIQSLVSAEAAGVAFTANPVTGDRTETIINAVRGLGERLVSGQASPDEWVVRGQEVICKRSPENSIDANQAAAITELARKAEAHFGSPQDVEWAIEDGKIYLLQSRPMTALPDKVEWKAPPLPGIWIRNFRLGEWLGDPVTPLFESWLLTSLGNRLNADFQENTGFPPPQAPHVLVNGWYFYCWNIPENPIGLLPVMLTKFLPKLLIQPRRALTAFPGGAHFGVELWVLEWRERVLPRYQEKVQQAESHVEAASPKELVNLIDQLADRAGDYFASIVKVSGFASKAEFALGNFYRQHLYPHSGGHYSRLLRGLYSTNMQNYSHAVESIDWFFTTLGERGAFSPNDTEAQARQARLAIDRQAAETEARAALAGQPKLLASFERLLATAKRFAPMREEQVSSFTIGWPVMRRAILRLGETLASHGLLADGADVFFLKRQELLAALQGQREASYNSLVIKRRKEWQRQRRLVPPLYLGKLPPMVKSVFDSYDRALRSPSDSRNIVLRGAPASPGRATGPARVIRGLEEFNRLQPGDVLVAPATMPAWTPLFALAAAVVTDTGGIAAHASIIAREYGIPAVVGTGDGTARLQDGQLVTVDGNAGQVEGQD